MPNTSYFVTNVRRLLSGIAVLCCCLSTRADYYEWLSDLYGKSTGHTGALFLDIPNDASALARGQSSLIPADEATALSSSIASTALLESRCFSATHLQWLAELRKEYLAACFPVINLGTFGFSGQLFTLGPQPYSYDIDEMPSKPGFAEFALTGTFARELIPDLLAAGVGASFIESRLDEESARTFGASGDLLLHRKWARLCFSIQHAGLPLIYADAPSPLPLRLGMVAGLYPMMAMLHLRNILDVHCAFGVSKTADEPLSLGLSTDMTIARYGRFRAGYEYSLGSEIGLAGLGVGAGFRVGPIGADFGWKNQSPTLGSVWSITATAQTDPVLPTSAEEYYAIAEQSFVKGRYRGAIRYAKSALRLNPSMWKAHALLAKASAQVRRKQGTEIALIYTGNLRGQFVPFEHHLGTVGGLARQATVIKRLRSQYARHAALITGDLIPSHSHPFKVDLVNRYLHHMKFDGVAAGPEELHWAQSLSSPLSPPERLLWSNVGDERFITSKMIKTGPYSLYVLNLIMDSDNPTFGPLMSDPVATAHSMLSGGEAKAATLRIVMIHGTWKQVEKCAASLPMADIIVCAGLSQAFQRPMKSGSSMVLSAGDSGKYVGELSLLFSKSKDLISYENRLIPLVDTILPDPTVDQKVNSILARIEQENGTKPLRLAHGLPTGAFPLVIHRNGESQAYLKVPEHHAEYPLSFRVGNASKPTLSRSGHMVAFVQTDPESTRSDLDIVDLSGTFRRTLVADRAVRSATFSPDGKWVYAIVKEEDGSRSDIVRLTKDGVVRQEVAAWKGSSEIEIALSPDNTTAAFCSDRDHRWHVYLSSPTGDRPIRITDAVANHRKPLFHPDGSSLAYLSDRTAARNRMDIWLHNMSTGKSRQLTRMQRVRDYLWIDNQQLLYTTQTEVSTFTIINIDPKIPQRSIPISLSAGCRIDDFRMVEVKGTRIIVYTCEYATGRKEVRAVGLDGTGDVRFMTEGEGWL